MKSFVVQPFGQRIGVTNRPKDFICWWNKYASNSAKMDVEDMLSCLGMAAALPGRPKAPMFVIYMPFDADVTTVFHESLHMAHFVMDHCVAPINLDSTETQAYLMEHIAEKVLEKMV